MYKNNYADKIFILHKIVYVYVIITIPQTCCTVYLKVLISYLYLYVYSGTVYYGHPGTTKKCPDYQGFLIFHAGHFI